MRTLHVDFESEIPVYRQIADEIRGLVARGELADGSELPSVRQLASRVGVNLNTIAKAYRLLADEGLVELRHGSGARVRIGADPYREPADDIERRLHDVLSRLVLTGSSRRQVERLLERAVDRFFSGPAPVRRGS